MEDMVRQSHSSAKKFIIRNVTQLFERRQVWRAVPVAPRAIQHRVDALAVWRFNETAPRAGGVRQTSNDGGTVNVAERRRPDRESVAHATRRPSAHSQSPDAGRAERPRSYT